MEVTKVSSLLDSSLLSLFCHLHNQKQLHDEDHIDSLISLGVYSSALRLGPLSAQRKKKNTSVPKSSEEMMKNISQAKLAIATFDLSSGIFSLHSKGMRDASE